MSKSSKAPKKTPAASAGTDRSSWTKPVKNPSRGTLAQQAREESGFAQGVKIIGRRDQSGLIKLADR